MANGRWALLAGCLCLPADSPPDGRIAKMNAVVDAYASLGESGVVVVAERGQVLLRRAIGYADRELGVPARPSHRFGIGSMTKAFTAVLVLQEVARGRIALDTPAVRYWPEFPDPTHGAITIRHLLTHRSGLKHWGGVSGFLEGPARLTQKQTDVVALFAGAGLSFPPGTREDYSSLGYMVLGIVLERVTGTSYATLLERQIFAPLRMTSTSLDDHDTILPGRARSYRYNFLKAGYDNAEYRDPSTTWSTGGIVTTADDLVRWSDALSTNKLLPDSLRALMFDRTQGDAWYGWRIDTTSVGARVYWHTGLETGFRGRISRIPSRGQTVIVLTNARDGDEDGISRRMLTILNGGAADLPKRSLAKAIYRAAAAGGGDSAVAVFRAIMKQPAGYETGRIQSLVAAIELRSDKACDRAAPIYEAWLDLHPDARERSIALAGAADCRLQLGQVDAARRLIDRLERLDPANASLAALKRRLSPN